MKSSYIKILFLLLAVRAQSQTCIADFDWSFDAFNPSKVQFINKSTGNSLIYLWTFGSGATSNAQSPSMVYNQNGSYQVCLLLQSYSDTSCKTQICKTLMIENAGNCISSYYFDRDTANPRTIYFHQKGFGDSLTYLWAFGDGTFSSSKDPVKTYIQNGNYNICLTVARPTTSGSSTFCSSFDVGTFVNDCSADFSIHNSGGSDIVFSPSAVPTKQRCVSLWSMGDGKNIKRNNVNNLYYQYQDAGNYLVCLNILDSIDHAFRDSFCNIVNVTPLMAKNKCTAKFSFLKSGPSLSYFFSAWSNYTQDSAKFFWTFGDGDTSTMKNPYHKFHSNGTYTICLLVAAIDSQCNETNCLTQNFIDSNVGIWEVNANNAFDVYPNPLQKSCIIQNKFQGQLTDLKLNLIDQIGRIVLEREIDVLRFNETFEIDLSQLSDGVYVLSVNNNRIKQNYKLIKN